MVEIGGMLMRNRNVSWFDVESTEDILANILSRVPVNSLLVFKSVSKLWYRLIHSPNFIKLQLSQTPKSPTYIIYPYMDEVMNLYLMKSNGEITEMITLRDCENISSQSLICSYSGLICCINYPLIPNSKMDEVDLTDFEIRICNPTTREIFFLPKGSPSETEISIGVVFCPITTEYKVFRFFHSKHESQDIHLECEIYSSCTGSWRGIGVVQHHPMGFRHCPLGSNHVFVNGKVYWFVALEEDQYTPGSILSIDIEENLRTINLPEEVTEHSFLVDLEGCLSLVAVHDGDEVVNIWVLDDSNQPNWEIKCSVDTAFSSMECVDFVTARKNEVFFITTEHYLIYNVDYGTWTELDLADTFERNSPVAFPYTESLLPCCGLLGSEQESDD
ncbi:F-box protein At5g49610 [Juglans microcarpa x Juglans regia]|uniref:F-box protein At5g49610 n=1 Tax=Juglans microcarpa x Juglans regia TaxID=2249226 RepID=UPI001B7E445A|nr:F-box protein At5g49610 [Juglans microcarpa x Juglans regia]XP_040988705.1 F-box protein At5g49610 [Juglans microcarpa x Juglans regia]XP_040988706.1 F-box protein At5g49610 [Juglans microcarpa x Juglans regia]